MMLVSEFHVHISSSSSSSSFASFVVAIAIVATTILTAFECRSSTCVLIDFVNKFEDEH